MACTSANPWPALHLVAGLGKFKALKLFIENTNYNVAVEDLFKNSTLHHAAKGRTIKFSVSLVDFPNCQCALEIATEDQRDQETGPSTDIERQGCIELLLEAGFDMWELNEARQAPSPGDIVSAEMLAWWSERLAKEAATRMP